MKPALILSACVLALGCGPLRSMVALAHVTAAAPEGYAARFVTDGSVLALRFVQPGMWDLVPYEPEVESGAVVMVTGVVSGGGRGSVTRCWDMRHAPADWHAHVVYREPDGTLRPVEVEVVDRLDCD